MNLFFTDWCITALFLIGLVFAAVSTKKYNRSVADFLAANRCAGRYLISVSMGAAGAGAINIMAVFEMYYNAGFTARWWEQMMGPIVTIVLISGWVIYRFRQTRALTMAQFFEMRYSRRFRIFAGILSFLSGIAGFAIAPAVGARFFIYYCGLPEALTFCGIELGTYPILMILLLGLALFFTFIGGQIAILVTDFVQGAFANIMAIIILLFLLFTFKWSTIMQGLQQAPKGASLIHPFDTNQVNDFNVWFFLIWAFSIFYGWMSWQGMQGFNSSAKNPHEARMASVVGGLRGYIATVLYVIIPLCAFTLLHDQIFASKAAQVNSVLSSIPNPQIQKQMTVPVCLAHMLPVGLLGCFCALMLGAFISSTNSHLHSWGAIFVQDVLLPFRKTVFSSDTHLRILRYSIFGVAAAVFMFSLYFKQTSHIIMWMNLTGAIYAGAGAVIIGGLYWDRSTTAGAWTSLIVGAAISVTGILIKQVNPSFFINEQVISFIAMACALSCFFIVSLLTSRKPFNMDKMLNRGPYAVNEDHVASNKHRGRILFDRLGITQEFTKNDKIIYWSVIVWTFIWFVIFLMGTIWNMISPATYRSWERFWFYWTVSHTLLAVGVVIWVTWGGIRDLKSMYISLASTARNQSDSGQIAAQAKTELQSAESASEKA